MLQSHCPKENTKGGSTCVDLIDIEDVYSECVIDGNELSIEKGKEKEIFMDISEIEEIIMHIETVNNTKNMIDSEGINLICLYL